MKLLIPNKFKDFNAVSGAEVTYYDEGTDLSEAEIIVGNPKVVFENPEHFPKLKFLQLLSAGYDSVPVAKLQAQGVVIANARGLYSVPIAEYALAHLLAYYKRVHEYRASQHKHEWNTDLSSLSLENKRALILGTGSIGFEIAKRLKAFDVLVDGANSNGRDIQGFDHCVSLATVESVLGDYDMVIAALPSNKDTIHRMNQGFFKAMKRNALFLNVGRGDAVDEKMLESALDDLACVILDVFENEPLAPDSFMWDHSKVILTPHSSNSGDLNELKTREYLHKNIQKFVDGLTVDNSLAAM